MSNTLLHCIRQLKSRWSGLDYLTKAEHISALVGRGISRRALARELGRSEALLRHLQKAASLPPSVKADIVSNRISFRAAVMSMQKASNRTSESNLPRTERRLPSTTTSVRPTRTPADANAWAKLIVKFAIKKYSHHPGSCRQLICEARAVVRAIPDPSRLNIPPLPAGSSLEFTIDNSRPSRRLDAFTDMSYWLAGWLLALIPDKSVREQALELAARSLNE
jgi:hypothetical protein